MELRKLGIAKKNKKGDGGYFAWVFIIVVLIGIFFGLLIINKVWGEINPELSLALNAQEHDANPNNTANITKVLEQTGSATQSFDNMLPFLLIGLFAFVLMSAGTLMKHPIMIFVGLIVLAVVILVAVVYANTYKSISDTPAFAETASELPIQTILLNHFPTIIFILSLGIVIFLLWRGSSGGGTL